jgi:ankyrin repeat protein
LGRIIPREVPQNFNRFIEGFKQLPNISEKSSYLLEREQITVKLAQAIISKGNTLSDLSSNQNNLQCVASILTANSETFTKFQTVFEQCLQIIDEQFSHPSLDAEASSPSTDSPLHHASRLGSLTKLEALLTSEGAQIDSPGVLGKTPLHLAAKFRQKRSLEALIAHGANINITDDEGLTPLHQALKMGKKGNMHAIEKLLDHRADINISDSRGKSPLHTAITQKNSEAINLLLSHSELNPNTQDQNGNTALHDLWLVDTGNKHLTAASLLSHSSANPQIQNKNGENAVMFALKNQRGADRRRGRGLNGFVKTALDKMSDLQQKDNEGNNLLLLAIREKAPNPVLREILSKMAANPEEIDGILHSANKKGQTPLSLLASKSPGGGQKALYLQEINKQLGLNLVLASDTEDLPPPPETTLPPRIPRTTVRTHERAIESPLHKASRLGSLSKLEELLSSEGVQINSPGVLGKTPLHIAAKFRKNEALEALIDHGANINMTDDEGLTPLHQALKMGKKGNMQAVGKLLDHGADVNRSDARGKSPLHTAVTQENSGAMTLLLNHPELNPNAIDQNGSTALHDLWFVDTGSKKRITASLLKPPLANPQVQNTNGENPIMFALKNQRDKSKRRIRGLREFVETVLNKMTDFQQKDQEGNNIVHLALQEKVPTPVLRDILTSITGATDGQAEKILKSKNLEGKSPLDLISEMPANSSQKRRYQDELGRLGLQDLLRPS